MKTVETENEGLKRAYTLTIPAKDIDSRVDGEIKRLAPTVRMPGFRPGKVPPNLIRKMHGEALMRDALNTAVQDGVQQLMTDKKLRPAMPPEVELDERYEAGRDAEVKVRLETLPDVPKPKIEGLKLERLTAEIDDAAIDAQLQQLATSQARYEDAKKGHKAVTGDQVVIDFVGKVDGVAFDGGTGQDMAVVLGSGQLIPGFEDQMIGVKAGDEKQLSLTFPDDYQVDDLKGKAATFDIKVSAVKTAVGIKIDDDFAKQLGLDDLDRLKGVLRDQQQEELNGLTRTHMKRRLLDQLAEAHDFDVPASMVDAEYENIMAQLRHEASHEADPDAALKEIEAEIDDYRDIAVRRVRLGLLLSEIGSANSIEVSQQEMNRLIGQAASQYQPKDRDNFVRYIQQTPMAAAQLRAPLYEDKVVDYLFGQAEITDRSVSRGEIEADLESEEGHVHGPGCGHEHSEAKKAKKPMKAAISKKAAPSKSEPTVIAKADAKPKPAKPIKDGAGGKPADAKAAKPATAAQKPAANKQPATTKKPAAKKK
ncbi:MAG: trigger factor [Sphingomonas sp.]|uniref:trigger factor n=1 Tax=Sphingomonas sp. TaxID=28214 RepID=UPI001836ADC5|nr:trigger factor [Sphingomonas sp.]MBA3666315.1 trigger factor [Sphingomonas sp.]